MFGIGMYSLQVEDGRIKGASMSSMHNSLIKKLNRRTKWNMM